MAGAQQWLGVGRVLYLVMCMLCVDGLLVAVGGHGTCASLGWRHALRALPVASAQQWQGEVRVIHWSCLCFPCI